jgi:phospholipid/cholesterol/gamma-HCH transport system substrate-binding protein
MMFMRRTRLRSTLYSALLIVAVAAMPGCQWHGVNSLPLPGTQGEGPGAFVVKAQLPEVGNIQQSARAGTRWSP